MIRLILILPLLSLLSGCAALGLSSDETGGFIFNERLARAYANPEHALKRGRAPLVMSSGRSVDNCVAYLEAGGHTQVAADINSRITPAQYLICDALAALKDARRLDEGDYRPESYGRALLERLDLHRIESSLSGTLEPGQSTLRQMEGIATRVGDHAVNADTRNASLRLETLAVAHLDDNDHPDWLVMLLDESKSGMYRSYQLLVISDVTATAPLRAEKFQL